MKRISTLAQLVILLVTVQTIAADAVFVKTNGAINNLFQSTSPFTLYYNPASNGVDLDQQRIDYDLSKENELRLGPFLLEQTSISLHLSREQGEYYDLDFGFDFVKRLGPIYVISFNWPTEYIKAGTLEILDDNGKSLWLRKVTNSDLAAWSQILDEENQKSGVSNSNSNSKLEKNEKAQKDKSTFVRPKKLSPIHKNSTFGLSHKGFYEIPISQSVSPFRFCVSSEDSHGRMALCSHRYKFLRLAGSYKLVDASKEVIPAVTVNDRPVNLKGTAVFLDNNIPIKFSALLKNSTYFEFVSHPKEIQLVDIIQHADSDYIEVIGFGDAPMGEISESFYADLVHWGFLNFMPTIGDLRKFWRASIQKKTPYLYLKGIGGAPFRQQFNFDKLPTTKERIILSDKTTKSTYSSKVWVRGNIDSEIKVAAQDTEVNRLSKNEFEWHFLTPESGKYNTGTLEVLSNNSKWKANYQIYRGYPAEIGARLSGVLTTDLKLVLLGEVAFQYWFESILGWQNYYLSHQRWGLATRYFEAFMGTDKNIHRIAVGTADLKYRFTPGVWGRDPTVGIMASALNLDYSFKFAYGDIYFSVPAVGAGVFWARSMPKLLDDMFNILPFMRYPKWVDWEFVYYPLTLREHQVSRFISAMNFHGKVQWTKNFFGEGGFGIKNFSFSDSRSSDPDRKLAPTMGIGYGTIGVGYNF